MQESGRTKWIYFFYVHCHLAGKNLQVLQFYFALGDATSPYMAVLGYAQGIIYGVSQWMPQLEAAQSHIYI